MSIDGTSEIIENVHVPGCPFELKVKNPYLGKEILAHGPGLYQCRTNQINSFTIDTRGFSSKLFDVVVAGPQDMAVPVRCYQQKDGNLLAQFTAPVSGEFYLSPRYLRLLFNISAFFLKKNESLNEKPKAKICLWNSGDAGTYKIDVLYDGKPLRGSPFTCQSFDVNKVTIDNVRSASVSVHESITFQSKLAPSEF